MDIFPIVLTNRDMQTLLRVVEEEFDYDGVPDIPGVPDDTNLDAIKGKILEMSSGEMVRFLDRFVSDIQEGLKLFSSEVSRGGTEGVENVREVRERLTILQGIRGRVRRSR